MSQEWKEKLAQAKTLFDEVKATVANEEATAEEKEQIQPKLEEAKKLKAEAMQLKDIFSFGIDLAAQAREVAEEQNQEEEKEKGIQEQPGEFKDWTEFLKAAYYAGHREPVVRKRDPRLVYFKDEELGHEKKQLVENVGASGGFLVPTEFLAQLQSVMGEAAIVRPRATVIRMRRRQIDIPVLDQTGTTTGQAHWFGGMLCYWAEEASEKTITTAEFRKVTLAANKLIMYTRSSDELLDDSAISLSDFLTGPLGFAGAIAWQEDYAFFNGTGTGQPAGIINAGATVPVARATAGTFAYADLISMVEAFLPSATGVWTITHRGMSNLMTVQDPVGNYIWQPNAREGLPAQLFGMPVVFTEKQPNVGTRGDVVLADWRYYLIGDRQATTVESTQYDYWRYDQTSWRAVHRVDGRPWLSSPLSFQGGEQVSPFVVLSDASSS